jgi:dTDP-4-dehydrorhamnose 3,5-epimerase
MSYISVTRPGQFRDEDRWHVHQRQTDRFVVPLGEMILALFDNRKESSSRGRLDVIRMAGPPLSAAYRSSSAKSSTSIVPIPPGVLHCIGNLSEEPFVLTNFPTEHYDASDEGRVPFTTVPVRPDGTCFAWRNVEVVR